MMNDDELEEELEFHFIHGRIYDGNVLYVTAIREDLEDDNKKHTFVFKRTDGTWSRSFINNRITDLLTYSNPEGRTLLAVAEDGEVVRGTPGGAVRGVVDDSDSGPSDLRRLVATTRIGSSVFAYGMRRQVYKADLDGMNWDRADDGLFVGDDSLDIAGIWKVVGPDPDNLIAFGLEGEIWTLAEGVWTKRESPTNVNLYSAILMDGNAVVCGAKGTVLSGSEDSWTIIENLETEADFWSVAACRGRIYLAAGSAGLFMLDEDAIVPADAPKGLLSDVSSLDVVGDNMLLVGDQIVVLFDGENWTNLEAPIA